MDQSPARPSKLAHVVLKTRRYKEVVDWYVMVLGAKIVHANRTATFMTYDDEHHRLAVLNTPALLPNLRGAAGVDHIAFTYASVDGLLSTYERLKTQGVLPAWSVNHGATLSLYYLDPDANAIELQVDVFESIEATSAFLADGRFAINPIGIDVDPEDLLTRWKLGASHEALTRWPEVVEPRSTPPPAAIVGRLQAFLIALAMRRAAKH